MLTQEPRNKINNEHHVKLIGEGIKFEKVRWDMSKVVSTLELPDLNIYAEKTFAFAERQKISCISER